MNGFLIGCGVGAMVGIPTGLFGFNRGWTALKTAITGSALSVAVMAALLLSGVAR